MRAASHGKSASATHLFARPVRARRSSPRPRRKKLAACSRSGLLCDALQGRREFASGLSLYQDPGRLRHPNVSASHFIRADHDRQRCCARPFRFVSAQGTSPANFRRSRRASEQPLMLMCDSWGVTVDPECSGTLRLRREHVDQCVARATRSNLPGMRHLRDQTSGCREYGVLRVRCERSSCRRNRRSVAAKLVLEIEQIRVFHEDDGSFFICLSRIGGSDVSLAL